MIRRDEGSEEFSVIVIAGHEQDQAEQFRTTVEVLDPGATGWRPGPNFPLAVKDTSAVTDRHGGIVVMGGLTSNGTLPDHLYRLPHAKALTWTEMPQKLSQPRQLTCAFLVSDEFCV